MFETSDEPNEDESALADGDHPIAAADASRRAFMRLAAATAGTAGASGLAAGSGTVVGSAHDGDGPCSEEPTETLPTTYVELEAYTSGWRGAFPPAIDGETNPDLELQANRPYVIRWTNGDGNTHNLAIRDEAGNTLQSTQQTSQQGDTRALAFVATEEMAEYVCEPHELSMNGDIRFANADPPESDYELGAYADGWEGESDDVQGETNPTLELKTGEEYTVTWYNRDGECHNLVFRDANGTVIERTEGTAEQDDWVAITFTATEGMAEYVCEPHESAMRGDVKFPSDEESDCHYELGGYRDGWVGEAPADIGGETNPTLEFDAGQRYTVTWHNRDGASHNFAIRDADGNTLESTSGTAEEGAATSLTFTATEEMVEYVCEPHQSAMNGDVRIDSDGSTCGCHYELGGNQDGWVGEHPAEIAGETNPALELVTGRGYTVTWHNRDGAWHNFAIRDADGESLRKTEVENEKGASKTLTFTATEEMVEYVCEPHQSTMNGQIDGTSGCHVELGGYRDGWVGEAPADIDGETNPTLAFEAGQEYTVTWHNRDGEFHNFAIRDADGNTLESTGGTAEEGAATSLTFTATAEMAEYVCEPHQSAMNGDIVVDE